MVGVNDYLQRSSRTVVVTAVGASAGLGQEIFKALKLAGGWRLVGTDASHLGIGLYLEGFAKTQIVPEAGASVYVDRMLELCREEKAVAVAPGSEPETLVIAANREDLVSRGILPMVNGLGVIRLCSNKAALFEQLQKLGAPTPITRPVTTPDDVDIGQYPVILKPARASGGSRFCFIAEENAEARFFAQYLLKRGIAPIVQQYIPAPNDEYTVGVTSTPDGALLGSIAMKRLLRSRLSYSTRYQVIHEDRVASSKIYEDLVVSSGISQGIIDNFALIRKECEWIAHKLDSRWSLNIQGRLWKGVFYPFEINPRHSGTTYLRALAGWNEPDILLKWCLDEEIPEHKPVKRGYYFRGLNELFVPKERMHDW